MENQIVVEPVVVVGTMPAMGVIETQDGEHVSFEEMSWRSKWSFIRLQLGRTAADKKIKSLIEEYKVAHPNWSSETARRMVLEALLSRIIDTSQREIQFILLGDIVKAVATTDHLLIPPQEVLEIAYRIDPGLKTAENFEGVTKVLEEIPGLELGFQLDPGNILTRRAIRIGYNARVMSCMNPLSYIGVGNLNRFKPGGYFEGLSKILRIKRKVDLEDRIRDALEGTEGNLSALKDMIENSKKVQVTPRQAKILITAFPVAYSAGMNTVKQIYTYFRDTQKETLWGLAQAASYVARHGDFHKNARDLDKTLGVVGAAYLGITDVDETASLAEEWLKTTKKVDLSEWI